MIKCPMCGGDNPDDATYCTICGCDFTGAQGSIVSQAQQYQYPTNAVQGTQQWMGDQSQQQQPYQQGFQNPQQFPSTPQDGITCPQCGTVNPRGTRNCINCGAELEHHHHHHHHLF